VILAAVKGEGARALPSGVSDGIEISGPRLEVSTIDDPASVRFCESVESGHSAHGDAAQVAAQLGITAAPVRMDSQAKYAAVARGDAEIYLRLPTSADYREKIWDHAAGALIVAEAGGVVTDIHGRPLEFQHGRELIANRGVIVSNGRIHARIIQAIERIGIGQA
jgi:3'(2'), 5'-bisphosphate nucleotidase